MHAGGGGAGGRGGRSARRPGAGGSPAGCQPAAFGQPANHWKYKGIHTILTRLGFFLVVVGVFFGTGWGFF